MKRCSSTSTIIFKMQIKAKRDFFQSIKLAKMEEGRLLISCIGEHVRKWSLCSICNVIITCIAFAPAFELLGIDPKMITG